MDEVVWHYRLRPSWSLVEISLPSKRFKYFTLLFWDIGNFLNFCHFEKSVPGDKTICDFDQMLLAKIDLAKDLHSMVLVSQSVCYKNKYYL